MSKEKLIQLGELLMEYSQYIYESETECNAEYLEDLRKKVDSIAYIVTGNGGKRK